MQTSRKGIGVRMPLFSRSRHRRPTLAAAAAVVVALTLAACSSSQSAGNSSSEQSTTAAATGQTPATGAGSATASGGAASGTATSSGSGSASAGSGDFLADAKAAVDKAYQGTWREPAPGPAAVKGKKIYVIPCGIAAIGCYQPALGVKDAAADLGWTVTMVDGKLTPAGYNAAIGQAVAQKPDGIVTVGIDCAVAKAALTQAKAAGIPTVNVYGIDCNDPKIGEKDPLFTAAVDTGTGQDVGAWSASTGAIAAQYLIAKTEGKAKVLEFAQLGFTNVEYIHEGFEKELAKCTTCVVTKKVTFTPADVANGAIAGKVTSGLLAAGDANAIYFDNDGDVTSAIPALKANPHPDWITLGHEGLPTTMPLVGSTLTALFAFSPEWLGWCGAYAMNEVLAKHPVTDCGLGLQILDADHNKQPADATMVTPSIDFKKIMRAQWSAS